MPLRSDPSLWWNLPDIIAAYQPVRAPDSLSARHNMARGGDSRYRAEPGVLPTWSGAVGWTFVPNQQLLTNLRPVDDGTWSMIVSCTLSAANPNWAIVMGTYGTRSFAIQANDSPKMAQMYNGGSWNLFGTPAYTTSGVFGFAGLSGYYNGVFFATTTLGTPSTFTNYIAFGSGYNDRYTNVLIKSALIANRTLTAAEMFSASRQMAYCHVNPDWSAWGRRRQYYFAPTAAATVFNPAWAERANRLIGGG